MSAEVVATDQAAIIAKIVLQGDLSGLTKEQKVTYYRDFCESLDLDPITRPFDYLTLKGKEVLYANKGATEQLRSKKGVSITDINREIVRDLCGVTVKGVNRHGRADAATGAVDITGLGGDSLANAFMKAETKAKRRLTLSICGLGVMDETEIETIDMRTVNEVVIDGLLEDLTTGREKMLELIERYEPLVSPDIIEVAKLNMEAATTLEELRASYADLQAEGKRIDKEEQKEREVEVKARINAGDGGMLVSAVTSVGEQVLEATQPDDHADEIEAELTMMDIVEQENDLDIF